MKKFVKLRDKRENLKTKQLYKGYTLLTTVASKEVLK